MLCFYNQDDLRKKLGPEIFYCLLSRMNFIFLQLFLKETVEISATWHTSTCRRNSLHSCDAMYIIAPANARGFFPIEILLCCTNEKIRNASLFVFSANLNLFDISVT